MKGETVLPFVGWGVAGIPVVVTFLQALFALAGVQGRSVPVVGGVVEAIISMRVFREAAILFKESTVIVLVLFVLIAVAWVGQGVAMGRLRNRDVTFACAGLVSVLFLALFFGVYAPLFSADVGAVGLGVFVATPFVASVGALGGAWVRDWDVDLEAETASTVTRAAESLESKRAAFEDAVARRLDDEVLKTLEGYAPGAVADARSTIEEERAAYAELESGLESVQSTGGDAAARRERAIELHERVESRDPEAAVEQVESQLEASVLDVVDRGDVEISVRSRYGATYELVNLPGTFREFEVSPDGRSTHVNDVAHAIRSMTDREEAGLDEVTAALRRVEVHRERIERHVEDAESSFHETLSAAEADLERTREELERLEGAFRERVEALLINGQNDAVASVHAVDASLRDARQALHECRFDDAQQEVRDARETGAGLLTTVQFFGSVAAAIGRGKERLSLPSETSRTVASAVKPAFEREYDVEYKVTGDAIVLRARDGDGSPQPVQSRGASSESMTESESTSRPTHVDMESVVDEVLLLLDELRDVLEPESRTVHLETSELPSYVATEESVTALERFAGRHGDLVESVNAPASLPGIVDVRFADGTTGDVALVTLQERFEHEYA